MIEVGDKVNGTDMNGKEFHNAKVVSVLKAFQVAIIKTGIDRLNTTEAYTSKLERIEE
jgi:hypothetical protein